MAVRRAGQQALEPEGLRAKRGGTAAWTGNWAAESDCAVSRALNLDPDPISGGLLRCFNAVGWHRRNQPSLALLVLIFHHFF
jgi:hypothetical protein